MTHKHRLVSLAGIVVGLVALVGSSAPPLAWGAEQTSPREPTPPPRLALLIGVQSYPKLGVQRQLSGSRNDVRLVHALLVDRFGFRPDEIVTLLDERATGASIRSEMGRLVERLSAISADGPAAQVVFYFSGHGSRVPDQEEGHRDCDEEDGLDETLVPYDAEREGGDQDIRDDELYAFVEAVCSGGAARVWTVLDCCHSGTGVRGVTTIRRLDRNVAPRESASGEPRKIKPKRLPDDAVVLSACRASEVEPEYRESDQSYGLLTRFLVQALRETPDVSALSYGMLRQMIVDRYQRDAVVPAPTPQLEGTAESLRHVVLGAGSQCDREPYFRAEPLGGDGRTVRLAAGAFHGITVGSLYQLYERPEQIAWQPDRTGDAQPSLAWLEIESVDGLTATARAFQWADAGQSTKTEIGLPRDFQHGYAVERYHEHAHPGARLRVVRAIDAEADGPPLGPDDPAVPPAVRDGLMSIRGAGESQWLTWVEGDAACDLLLRIDGHYAALFPAIGMTAGAPRGDRVRGASIPASLRGGWGPIDLAAPDEAGEQLKDYLRRIVRARNLIRLAATQTAGGGQARVDIELLAVKLNRDLEIETSRRWAPDAERSLVMQKDDLFALSATLAPSSPKAMYVTVLAIDPDMQIHAVLPHQEGVGLVDQQRLEPGASRTSSPYQCTEPYGPHQAIVLATEDPNDFQMLAQPALPRTRSTTTGSPLDELLLEHTYFRTRGRRPRPQQSADPSWSATLLRWEAVP